MSPDAIKKATLNTDLASVLDGIQIGKGGFAFAVNSEDNTFAYFPDAELTGELVTDHGMKDYMLKKDYNDFINIDGQKYYTASGVFDKYIIYIAVPNEALNTAAAPVAVVSTIVMFVFMMILWAMFSFNSEAAVAEPADSSAPADNKKDNDVIDVDMGGGRKAKSRSVAFRWSHAGIEWEDMSAGQKTTYLLNMVLTVIAFLILIAVVFADKLFPSNSLAHFILAGRWQR